MKKWFKYWRISLCIALCLFCGCGKSDVMQEEKVVSEATEDSEMVQKNWMTKEYIIEHGLATEEDLEGVDVEAMVKAYGWEEGIEEKRNIPLMIDMLKKKYMLDDYAFDYQYLVDASKSEGTLTESNIKSIKTIGFESNEGTYFASMIFDLSEGKAYFGDGQDLLKKGVMPTKEIELNAEEIERIKEHIVQSNVYSWKHNYEGNQGDGTTGWFWWDLYYELENGEIYRYGGFGASGESTPENYDEFVEGLQAFFETEE